MPKLVWKVQEKPKGPYASFQHRGWPQAFVGDEMMVSLSCAEDYHPEMVRSGIHPELRIRVTDRRPNQDRGFTWKGLKQRAKTMAQAKEIAQKFFDANHKFFGLEEKK